MRFLALVAPPLLLAALVTPLARAQGPSPAPTLEIGVVIQPRYEYTFRDGEENLSSFYLRRVRLDIRGQIIPGLTYRILPEMARQASMRDVWLNYAFSPALEVRFGQFTVPFQWHRYISPQAQHFAERGVPSETFGFPRGRDIGLMLHGVNGAATLSYKLGLFDGAGLNTLLSNSDGHMASARLTWAVRGPLPEEESDLRAHPEPGLSLGLGIQAATENEARAWDLARSPAGNSRADWVTATADLSLRWAGFSLAAEAYLRHVAPADPDVDPYAGWAYMATAGYFVLPQRLELVARYSDLRLDAEDPATRDAELGVGMNVFLRGHGLKTRIQYLTRQGAAPAAFGRDAALLVELSMSF